MSKEYTLNLFFLLRLLFILNAEKRNKSGAIFFCILYLYVRMLIHINLYVTKRIPTIFFILKKYTLILMSGQKIFALEWNLLFHPYEDLLFSLYIYQFKNDEKIMNIYLLEKPKKINKYFLFLYSKTSIFIFIYLCYNFHLNRNVINYKLFPLFYYLFWL